MKNIITFIFLLLFVQICFGKEFIEQPIHKDNFLNTLNLPMEEELNTLLKGRDKEFNIILNFLKTIDFCDGVVSRIIYDKYTLTLSLLPEEIAIKVKRAEKEVLDRKKRNLSIIDVETTEHYLPIKFIDIQK